MYLIVLLITNIFFSQAYGVNLAGVDVTKEEVIVHLTANPGAKGEPGIKGEKGDQGSNGLRQMWGASGLPGENGQKGDKGDRGESGLEGLRGWDGDKGDKGDEGANGPTGYPGIPGQSGDKGNKGDEGANGPTGYPGIPGQSGDKGNEGDEGANGPTGYPGIPGQSGDKGNKGDEGANGPTGYPGIPGQSGDKGNKGDEGANGPTGYPGIPGQSGDKGNEGDEGANGPTGYPGIPGQSGNKGDKGESGLTGYPGIPGQSGDKGENGLTGYPGIPGQSGDKGDKGEIGHPGACFCKMDELVIDESLGTDINNPDSYLCGHSGKTNVSPYYVGDVSQPIEVECNEYGATCIKKSLSCSIDYHLNSFWLSELDSFIIKAMYNLTRSQVLWLQERSTSVNQTIRYHCKNSKPYDRYDDTKTLEMLTFFDITIGPVPSRSSPFYYSVKNDGCMVAEVDEWSYTDIVLETDAVHRLPIVDFFIRDVMNSGQEVRLENIELCFR